MSYVFSSSKRPSYVGHRALNIPRRLHSRPVRSSMIKLISSVNKRKASFKDSYMRSAFNY
ncbi:hypothetical protein KY289_002738 [Solanum tuberosum]|nr:hypothetical protein KY289_002738 [Solanum tuberosum]